MSDESVVFYSGSASEVNDYADNENDDLQSLIHAAADADARDNEALQEEQIELSSEGTSRGEKRKYSIEEEKVSGNQRSTEEEAPRGTKRKSGEKTKYSTENEKVSGYYRNTDEEVPRGTKRKSEGEISAPKRLETEDGYIPRQEGHANVVATHYNTIEEKGLDERFKSRIFYMRNFNNWIKSMLINEYLNKVKDGKKHNSPIRVMDMCCGKGGDLLKWRKGNISYLICTDIASISLEQCESRYNEMKNRQRDRVYRAEFIPGDCTKMRLREKYSDPSMKLDLVSCQFAFHYSFESLPQAECMLRNAAECLQPGGYFIGTIPDANEILARQRKSSKNSFGNDVYQINFQCETELPPLFGAKYNFHLEDVVDCPEFLVHFPTFEKLAKKFGLQLVKVEKFFDFYQRMREEGGSLLQKMQCLETYPAYEGTQLVGTHKEDYNHVEDFIKLKNIKDQRIGTLSKSEWEATSLYLTFAFRKAKTTWDSKGNPQYEFS